MERLVLCNTDDGFISSQFIEKLEFSTYNTIYYDADIEFDKDNGILDKSVVYNYFINHEAYSAQQHETSLQMVSIATDFMPIIGTWKMGIEALSGTDYITGRKLSKKEQAICFALTLLHIGFKAREYIQANKVIQLGAIKNTEIVVEDSLKGVEKTAEQVDNIVAFERKGSQTLKEWKNVGFEEIPISETGARSSCEGVVETSYGMSSGNTNKACKNFWKSYDKLPKDIQKQADSAFEMFNANPNHPGLNFEQLEGGQFYSVRINNKFRAYGRKLVDGGIEWVEINGHDYKSALRILKNMN